MEENMCKPHMEHKYNILNPYMQHQKTQADEKNEQLL